MYIVRGTRYLVLVGCPHLDLTPYTVLCNRIPRMCIVPRTRTCYLYICTWYRVQAHIYICAHVYLVRGTLYEYSFLVQVELSRHDNFEFLSCSSSFAPTKQHTCTCKGTHMHLFLRYCMYMYIRTYVHSTRTSIVYCICTNVCTVHSTCTRYPGTDTWYET